MSELSGSLFIGGREIIGDGKTFRGTDPASDTQLDPAFREATPAGVADAVEAAHLAFAEFSVLESSRQAEFLRAIADELLAAGLPLLERASAETALPIARLESERARTRLQLRLMAETLDEGSWVAARIGNRTRIGVLNHAGRWSIQHNCGSSSWSAE